VSTSWAVIAATGLLPTYGYRALFSREPRIEMVSGASDLLWSSSHSSATPSNVSRSAVRRSWRSVLGSTPSARSFRASSRFSRALESHVGIGAEGDQLLTVTQAVFEPPQAAPGRGYEQKQSAPILELVLCGTRFRATNSGVAEHAFLTSAYPTQGSTYPPTYPTGNWDAPRTRLDSHLHEVLYFQCDMCETGMRRDAKGQAKTGSGG
jgi:hypothetical protein